ncbi:phage tail protein [Spirulina sp. CS-785/01]|uniref:phage tail protein n=1 Tax=Spirulina sp. CS-785/01 TaxID=3021716 RepID=UPI00232F796A|nr:phage tail protein [Spirulina sp. CS-785/01]MDB9314575.1 phage tail protein [Spirulina sp. CS-785/01]
MAKLPEVLINSKFYLELSLDGSQEIDAFFMECQGFKRSHELIEIAEVTSQKWGKKGNSRGRVVRTKMPGNTKSENITLKRGLTNSMSLWTWFKMVEDGKWGEKFRDGDITIYDQASREQARFRFKGAWPISYTISDLSANNADFELEELELAVDEFNRVKKQT